MLPTPPNTPVPVKESVPSIEWVQSPVAGRPMIVCSDGTKQVLTRAETLHLRFGLVSVLQLNERYRKDLPPTRG